MDWVETTGGPLLLLAHNNLHNWAGLQEDYERACQIMDYVGKIGVGPAEALVLGGESMPTALWVGSDGTIILVRWLYAENEGHVKAALEAVDSRRLQQSGLIVDFGDDHVRLFDSGARGATSGSDFAGHIDFRLPDHRVSVSTEEWKPDNQTCLILHCLRPIR